MSQQADGQEVAWVSKDGHLRLVFRGQTSAIFGSGIVAPLYDLEELDEQEWQASNLWSADAWANAVALRVGLGPLK